MLEEAYYHGLKPSEVTELTAAQMAVFIKAQRKRRLDDYKMLAKIGYSVGILGSMALEKKRPKFEEVFKFEKEPEVDVEDKKKQLEISKANMIAWAVNANIEANKEVSHSE